MRTRVYEEMNRIAHQLVQDQLEDGTWRYPFETGIASDCSMIILLRTLEIKDEEDFIKELVERIAAKQKKDGSWRLFHDQEKGNLTSTVEAYYALLYSGYRNPKDQEMQAARRFILANGGAADVHMFLKILLALTGQCAWPHFPINIEVMLLPDSFPINLFDLSVYGRANIIPFLILANTNFRKRTPRSPNLSDLFQKKEVRFFTENQEDEVRSVIKSIKQGIKGLKPHVNLRELALSRAEQYMLDRIEPDGTYVNYFSTTSLMIYALLARGYPKTHPVITRAVQGLKAMTCRIDGELHCQYTTATVWNTTLINYALQEAGVPYSSNTIQKANDYILSRQHLKYGDWAIHESNLLPGGWGFADMNTFHPDIDDTTAALRAIRTLAKKQVACRQAWDRGLKWLISMQNNDGGWPAFEKNVDKKVLNLLPIEGGKDLLIDPSTVDLTGRTLEFFGNYTHLDRHHPMVKRGIRWLLRHQNSDGSWVGRWGVYIYGTWAAVTGLIAVGVPANHSAIQKALAWLRKIQNSDGGWGESCKSDIKNCYVPLRESTRTHTAWALDTLILASTSVTPEMENGAAFLVDKKEKDWTTAYPKGRGMAGSFYINYHCYEYVFPLLSLAHYQKLAGGQLLTDL
ncbi:squalene--hopene cyclase [[Bacillus] enclensis]|uniref:Sporulenol synthase n=1 Tax=[Bacillus] enclensis TaxID=1402860 RepID=A0A0V8H9A2_9BACI|nr:squalene--hopene cyclase [[Bacillus] enclensis]KSU59058.1 squalene--hopene cyclase [[Bacillus] enclensis]SCC31901.1 sporulenol synthase [[Bacillus] enclensis]